MNITRSPEIRACEAARRDFLADSYVQSYWGTRVFLGPQVGDDASIVTPQLALIPIGSPFAPGTTGISITDVSFAVAFYEKFNVSPYTAGGITEVCRARHLQKILECGSDGDGSGELVDPDNPDSTIATLRVLNTGLLAFSPLTGVVKTDRNGQPIAIRYSFIATFQTHLDNLTIDRPSGG